MRSIGHHEAMAELVRQHDDERPYAPENGHPLAFAPGDRVTFVNDYGVRFPCVKKTFCRNKERRDVRSHKNLQGVSV